MRSSKHTVKGLIRGVTAEEVFDYMASPERIPEWMSHIKAAECDEEMGLGTTITCKAHWMGRDFDMHQVITTYERPHRYGAACDEPVPTTFDVELTETPQGTHVTVVGGVITKGIPGGALIAGKVMRNNLETMMRAMHRDLESQQVAS